MVRLGYVSPEVWDKVVEFMEHKFADLDFREEDIQINWKADAKLQRTARELYEIYGIFRFLCYLHSYCPILKVWLFLATGPFKDILLHPNVLWATELMNNFIVTDFFMGEPILPVTAIVVILFMVRSGFFIPILSTLFASLYSLFSYMIRKSRVRC